MKKLRVLVSPAVFAAAGLFVAGLGRAADAPSADQANPGASGGVRIAAWNMKWFPLGRPLPIDNSGETAKARGDRLEWEKRRLNSAARFIRWQDADVVLLEEMRDRKTCEELVAQPCFTNWKVNACSEFPQVPEATIPAHQNAIVSRFVAVDAGFGLWKTNATLCPPRGYVWAVLDIRGSLVAFVGVHLKSNYIPAEVEDKEAQAKLNTAIREESARQLVAFADTLHGKRYGARKVSDVFLAGDFNTSIFDKAFAGEKTIPVVKAAGYKDCFDKMPEASRYTMPESKWYPPTVFDYLFHKGRTRVSGPEVSIPSYTSDHQMISVVFAGGKPPVARPAEKPEGKAGEKGKAESSPR